MILYRDKQGQPIELDEWASKMSDDYRVVKKTVLPNGYRVSTVWLGIDHSFGHGPPLIFETMVFPECDYCERYATLSEAQYGHQRAIEEYLAK